MFKAFGGVFSSEADRIVGIFGVDYTLPFLIETRVWIDTEADVRVAGSQEIPITHYLSAKGEIEYVGITAALCVGGASGEVHQTSVT